MTPAHAGKGKGVNLNPFILIMNQLLPALFEFGVFQCPHCRYVHFFLEPHRIVCQGCGQVWPVRHSVPDFFNDYQNIKTSGFPSALFEQEFCEYLLRHLNLPKNRYAPIITEIVRRASTLACMNESLTAEIQDLMDRFGFKPRSASARAFSYLRRTFSSLRVRHRKRITGVLDNMELKVQFLRHYLPAKWRPNIADTANIRLKNIGNKTWVSTGKTPIFLSYHWLDHATGDMVAEGLRTRFPIAVAPQRSLTLPLRVKTPENQGEYVLRVQLVHEHVEWVDDSALEVVIGIDEDAVSEKTHISVNSSLPSYAEDHQLGVRIIEEHLNKLPAKRKLLLEVGSGTHPHIAYLPNSDIVALDISAPLLELGAMYFECHGRTQVCFVCADAMRPPFAEGRFDGIALFSALHHFPEPERLLASLKKLIKPEGFIAVMCEPVGDNLDSPEAIRDLHKGINEQVFSPEEYLWIFTAAGLEIVSLRLDGGSLKAVLR